MLADVRTSGYTAYVEDSGADAATLAEALDRKLCDLNIEYAAKRASGRLKPINVTLLRPGTETAYYRHCIETRKQREAQLKYLVLQDAMDSDFDFAAYGKADAGVLVQGR